MKLYEFSNDITDEQRELRLSESLNNLENLLTSMEELVKQNEPTRDTVTNYQSI